MSENAKPRSTRRTRRAGRKYQERKRRAQLIKLLNEEGIEVPGFNVPRETPVESPDFDYTSIFQTDPSYSPTHEEQPESI